MIILPHYSAAFNLLGLDSLSNGRVEHCRKLAKGLSKLKQNADLIPPTRLRCHGRNLRSKNKISQLPIKTARFANSWPIPYFIQLLNS